MRAKGTLSLGLAFKVPFQGLQKVFRRSSEGLQGTLLLPSKVYRRPSFTFQGTLHPKFS